MRIAIFSGNYNYVRDGANQALNRLAAHLETHEGCEVRAYSPVTRTPAFEPSGTLVPVPSVALPRRREFRLALGLPHGVRRDLERFRPDIIHVSAPDILGTRAQTYALRRGIPVVASMHTRFETYLDYYRLGWLRPLICAHLDRFYRRSHHVLAPTPALAEQFARLRGDDHVSVWSRGIDRSLFHPSRRDMAWRQAQGLRDEDFVVLFFGRLVLEKGIATFTAAMRALQKAVPARALVVGAGPAAAAFAGLPGTVMTGHLAGDALARAVASADAMLCPSTTEAFGNVILEAMASGVPVVSADAPSARMLLGPGDRRQAPAGFLCPPQDVAAYAGHLAALAAAPDVRQAMGAAARRDSAAYSWDAAGRSVARIYRALAPGAAGQGDQTNGQARIRAAG